MDGSLDMSIWCPEAIFEVQETQGSDRPAASDGFVISKNRVPRVGGGPFPSQSCRFAETATKNGASQDTEADPPEMVLSHPSGRSGETGPAPSRLRRRSLLAPHQTQG